MTLSWLAANPRTARKPIYGAEQRAVIDPARVPDVGALLGAGHGPTPLYALPALATRLGLGGDDPPISSGPSSCAGLAGLTRVCTDQEAFKALHLDKRSRVLLI